MPRQAPLKLINGTGLPGLVKEIGATAVLSAPAAVRRAMIGAGEWARPINCRQGKTYPISDEEILDAKRLRVSSLLHLRDRRGRPDPMAVVDPLLSRA